VQPGELLVTDAVGRRQVVEPGASDRLHDDAEIGAVVQEPAGVHRVRAGGDDRQGGTAAGEDDVPVVARAGAGTALHRRGDPDAPDRHADPGAKVEAGHQNMKVELMIAPLRP
jgi:hypothetical protein